MFGGSSVLQRQARSSGESDGTLVVDVRDGTTGSSVPCRVRVVDGRGRLWSPDGVPVYRMPPEEHFVSPGRTELRLPPGLYSLSVERGPEYESWMGVVLISAGAVVTMTVPLVRWIDMNSLGWYSGDLHNHRALEEMPRLVLSEDVNLATTITDWHTADASVASPPTGGDGLEVVDPTHVFTRFDKEIERFWDGPGAICLLGLSSPYEFAGYRLFPATDEICRAARKAGAHVTVDKPMWRDVPALAALGLLDSIGIVHNMFTPHGVALTGSQAWMADSFGLAPPDHPSVQEMTGMVDWGLAVYYRLLNCGLKLPASAGTASGVLPSPLGYNRVYVRLGATFDAEGWWKALAAGRSFATNGPMVFLTVDGRSPGTTLRRGAGDRVSVRAEATSPRGIARVELVVGGEVVAASAGDPSARNAVVETGLEVERSTWICARAFEEDTDTIRFGHTSPVYVSSPGSSPVRHTDAVDLAVQMEGEATFYEGHRGFDQESHRAAMVDMFRRAGAVYERLARSAR